MNQGWLKGTNLIKMGQMLVTLCDTCNKPLKNRYKDTENAHNCSKCNNFISLNDLKAKRIFKE